MNNQIIINRYYFHRVQARPSAGAWVGQGGVGRVDGAVPRPRPAPARPGCRGPAPRMSDWPPCRDGGGAGGAGQKLTHPLPPILRPQQPDTGQPPDNAPPNISQPKSLRSAVFSKVKCFSFYLN